MEVTWEDAKEFLRWLRAVLIMVPVTLYVLVVGILFYIYIRLMPTKENGGANSGYCDHLDDLI